MTVLLFKGYVAMTGLLHSNYTGHSSLSDISLTFKNRASYI